MQKKKKEKKQVDNFPTSASRLRIQIEKQTKPNDMLMDDGGDAVRRKGGKKREDENLVEQYRDT